MSEKAVAGKLRDEGELVAAGDTAGLDRMTLNVLSNWGGHLVVVAAGFVLPRLIDHHVGQAALGIWDFSWSMVSYFSLAAIGIGSSVSRHVALHRAANDAEALRRTVSSVACVNWASALVVLVVTGLATWFLPDLFGARLGAYTAEARWVVGLLGAGLAFEMSFDTFRGVMTGCHRWDLHNAINAGFYAATVVAMIAVLRGGGGLKGLAIAHTCGVVAAELTRMFLSYRVCPELRIRFEYAEWGLAMRLLLFGGKSMTMGISRLLLLQTNSMLIALYLGPGALAVFSRIAALMRHAVIFAGKFALVMTPAAGSLQGSGRLSELRELLITSTRYGTALQLPVYLSLAILGDPILRLWMGSRYEQGLPLAILAMGAVLPGCQGSATNILIGMNLHGRLALVSMGGTLLGIGLSMFGLSVLRWGLLGVAMAQALPTMANGLYIGFNACHHLGISPREYVRRVFLGPVACAIPFALCLLAGRLLFGDRPLLAMASGCAPGALVLGSLYWRYLLPMSLRRQVTGLIGRTLRLGYSLRT